MSTPGSGRNLPESASEGGRFLDRLHFLPAPIFCLAQTLAGTTNGCLYLRVSIAVGLGIVDERLGRGIDMQLAAQPIGDIAQVAIGAGEVALLDIGVQEVMVARLDGLDEIGEVVAAAGAAGAFLEVAAEVTFASRCSW